MEVMLTPPWYTLVNELKYTYGKSPFIFVLNLVETGDGTFNLPIKVMKNDVAKALRQIIPITFIYGTVVVTVVIYNADGDIVPVDNTMYTPETLAALFCIALKYNPLFKGVVLKPAEVPGTVADVNVIIAKEVIQFFNDDISDLCSNYNEVAARTFELVTLAQYAGNLKVGFTTYDAKCKLQKNIFCPVCKRKHI